MAFITPGTVVAGDVLTAARYNQDVVANGTELAPFFGAWESYTPVLTAATTNPTLGTGSNSTARYLKVGRLVIYTFSITFGTSGTAAGSGEYRVSLPFGRASSSSPPADFPPGMVRLFDSSASATAIVPARMIATTNFIMQYPSTWPATGTSTVNQAAPWAWDASDSIRGQIIYEAES
jgi:hypothetical protein